MSFTYPVKTTTTGVPVIVGPGDPSGTASTFSFNVVSDWHCQKRPGWRHLDGPCTDACPFGPIDV